MVLLLLVEEELIAKKLVAVALVVLNRVIVPDAAIRLEIDVVAKVEVPVTTKALVVVLLVTVRLVMKAVAAFKIDAKRLVEDEVVKTEDEAKRLVVVLLVEVLLLETKPRNVPLVAPKVSVKKLEA